MSVATLPPPTRPDSPSPAPKQHPSRNEVRRRLLAYLKPFRAKLAFGLTCGALVGLAQASLVNQLKDFIDGLSGGSANLLAVACVMVVVLYAAMGLLKYVQSITLATVAQYVGQAIRKDIYSHLQALSLSYFHKRRTGAMMSTLTSDVPKMQNAAMMLKDVVATPIQAVIFLVMLFLTSWQLTLFVLVVVPVMGIVIQRLTRSLRAISQETQTRVAAVAATMEETLSAPRVVRAFTAEDREVHRFEKESKLAIDSLLKAVRRQARLGPTVDVIGAVGIASALYVGGRLVQQQAEMTAGDLVKYLSIVSFLANCVNAMGNLKGGFEDMMGAADRIFTDVLDVVPDVRDDPNAKVLPQVQGRIELQDVHFHYDPDKPVLRGIDLTVKPGEMVAFVGETGSGKSTLADLLPRFYDPTEGAILIDGHDLRDVTQASLRKQIGLVPQEPQLFSGTIRENIAYARPDATLEEVQAAARIACIAEFIESLPSGYETWIGERGTTLSGGQRQRIAIARALLANPRILILDEATSALDATTEAQVQGALEDGLNKRTTIVIAHRLSTIVRADQIVVLQAGRIAERGTHNELMTRGGIYATLYETQQRRAEMAPLEP